jgi:hypothetical protein
MPVLGDLPSTPTSGTYIDVRYQQVVLPRRGVVHKGVDLPTGGAHRDPHPQAVRLERIGSSREPLNYPQNYPQSINRPLSAA